MLTITTVTSTNVLLHCETELMWQFILLNIKTATRKECWRGSFYRP